MKLIPVPGAPGYRVDIENEAAYCLRNGMLRPLSFRTKYRTATLRIDGRCYGTTIYRMMYCAKNGIDITKIPSDLCITTDNGALVVMSREQISAKRHKYTQSFAPNLERLKKNIELIEKYYKGDTEPLLSYLEECEHWVTEHYVFMYGFSRERAEIIVGIAINKFLDRLASGFPTTHIKAAIYRYARGESSRISKQREMFDNTQPIEI